MMANCFKREHLTEPEEGADGFRWMCPKVDAVFPDTQSCLDQMINVPCRHFELEGTTYMDLCHVFHRGIHVRSEYRRAPSCKEGNGWTYQKADEIPGYKRPELPDGWYIVCYGQNPRSTYIREKRGSALWALNPDGTLEEVSPWNACVVLSERLDVKLLKKGSTKDE